MSNLFSDCFSLQFLDVYEWDTSNIENINGMFCGCVNLTKIDVP